MLNVSHLTYAEMEAGLEVIRQSPKENGVLRMIVRRPQTDEREELVEGELSLEEGLVGDSWKERYNRERFSSADINAQITIMNARAIALLAQSEERWSLAGDQFFVDFDLSDENIPAGTQLAIGTAVVEVTAEPHTGCKKFAARFGTDATKFVNSPEGKRLHLRGINCRVVRAGTVRVGDIVKKA
jgi:hypothetical protein